MYLLLVSIFSMLIVVFVHKIREFFTIQNLIDDISNKILNYYAGKILNWGNLRRLIIILGYLKFILFIRDIENLFCHCGFI